MPLNTLTVVATVTPTVIKTYISHVRDVSFNSAGVAVDKDSAVH